LCALLADPLAGDETLQNGGHCGFPYLSQYPKPMPDTFQKHINQPGGRL